MTFHPSVYLYYWFSGKWEASTMVYLIFLIPLMVFSLWIFIISQRFQKPILFDTRTENERKDNLTELAMAVKDQTTTIKELVELLKTKQDDDSPKSGGKNNNQ
jgi:hypothetical protein